ncbi:MAG: hypothetical protein AAGK32_09275 [Actinomycetota bacterium]
MWALGARRRDAGPGPVVMVDRFDGSDAARLATAVLWWAETRDLPAATAIVWETGPAGWAIPSSTTVREVESINRWAVPRELARYDLTRPVGRAMRHARVRFWWERTGPDPRVAVIGELRPELHHYAPPSDAPPRRLEPGGSLEASLWAAALRRRFGVPGSARLIGGAGAPVWRFGVDQFLAAAAEAAGHDHYVWCHPRSSPVPPEVRHDAVALGIDDRLHFLPTPGRGEGPLRGCDVVLSVARRAGDGPDDVGVARVGYGTEGVPAPGARPEALAAAIAGLDPVTRPGDQLLAEELGWSAA